MILETACDLTSAETGYILRYNDKNELDAFVAYDSNTEANYYSYIIERTNENIEGIFAAQSFDKKAGNIDIFLPGNIKAVICIPIYSHESGDRYSSVNRQKENAGNQTITILKDIFIFQPKTYSTDSHGKPSAWLSFFQKLRHCK